MADATEVAQAYSQTVVGHRGRAARTTDEINKKRGVTPTAAEADKPWPKPTSARASRSARRGRRRFRRRAVVSEFEAVQSASDQAANAFGDLAARIITGGVSFRMPARLRRRSSARAFEDVLSSTLGSVFKAGFDAAGGVIDSLIGDFAGSLGSAMGWMLRKKGRKGS